MRGDGSCEAPASPIEPRDPHDRVIDLELFEILEAIGHGQIIPHYQPLVLLSDGKLMGVEALARWDRPGVGRVLPVGFLPCLERARRVSDLTASMLDRACRDLASWHRLYRLPAAFTVAVNVSATELVDHRLVGLVQEVLAFHRVPAAGLCLELTETAQIDDLSTAAEVFAALRELGVRMAIDDFGAGHTSQRYLEELPFDMVKIDQSYVAALGHRAESLEFIAQLVLAATSRRVEVVAEGVETAEQVRALLSLGCRHGQGWGLGPAAPGDQLLAAWV